MASRTNVPVRYGSAAPAIRARVRTASTGYLPTADSPESITQSVPSMIALATSVASARVGRAFPVIDSSICVAVMTGFPRRFARWTSRFCSMAIRSIGISTPRSPRAIMMPSAAPRIPSIRPRAIARSILAMRNGLCPAAWAVATHLVEVFRRGDEGLAHRVDAVLECELQALLVPRGKGVDPEVDAGRVEPLARAELAPGHHATRHVVPPDLLHFEADDPVVQIQGVSLPDRCGEAAEVDRCAGGVAHDGVGREGERVPRLEQDRLRRHGADAYLRPGEVRHDGERPARPAGGAAEVFDDPPVVLEDPVGKVQPGDVHPRKEQLVHDLRRIGRRADGADDPGFVGGQDHAAPPVFRFLSNPLNRCGISTLSGSRRQYPSDPAA